MKKALSLLLVLLMIASLVACGGTKETDAESTKATEAAPTLDEDETYPENPTRTDINVALTSALATGDPQGNSKDATTQVAIWIYDALIAIAGDGTISGAVAEKWEVSEDGTVYTFTLRDAKFHNGEKITAEDVKWSIERCALMGFFKNYTQDVTSVEAKDEKTVVVTIKAANNSLLYNLYRVKILNKSKVYEINGVTAEPKAEDFKDKEVDGKTVTADTQYKAAYYQTEGEYGNTNEDAGSGPFYVTEFKKDSKVVLKKFDEYWNKNTGNIKGINIFIMEENSARMDALESGELDFVQVPTASWDDVKSSGKFETYELASSMVTTIIVNHYHEGSPLGIEAFRQAIRYAMNRDAIIAVAASGMGVKAYTLYNPDYIIGSSHVNDGTFEYDVTKAKALMKEAGYENGYTFEKRDGFGAFLVPKTGDLVSVATVVQQQLEAVGVKIDINQQSSTDASAKSKDDNFDMYITASNYVFCMSDAARAMHSRTVKTQVAKYAKLPNNKGAELDDLFDRAAATNDTAERDKLYEELNAWINERSINIPLYYQTKGFAWSKDLAVDLSDPYYLQIQTWNWKK